MKFKAGEKYRSLKDISPHRKKGDIIIAERETTEKKIWYKGYKGRKVSNMLPSSWEEVIEQSEYKGELKGFPKEIVEAMLDEQERQGQKRDVTVFEASRGDAANWQSQVGGVGGGFLWSCSKEGHDFWEKTLHYEFDKGFTTFYNKYPKQNIEEVVEDNSECIEDLINIFK